MTFPRRAKTTLLLSLFISMGAACGEPDAHQTAGFTSSLTAAACTAGARNGMVGICHATDSNTFVYLTVSTSGCSNGHTQHASDFISADPSCRPSVPQNCQQVVWRRSFGTSGDDVGAAVATDGSGNVYVAGRTKGMDGVPAAGYFDAYLMKLDAAGNRLWTRQFGSSGADQGLGVATSTGGHVYVSGVTEGTLPGNSSAGGPDLFLAQFDAAGNQGWLRQVGTSAGDLSYGVVADASDNAYVVGDTSGSLQPGATNNDSDLLVIKFDGAGNQVWTRQLGSASALPFASAGGRAIATVPGGGVVAAGFTEAASFDGHTGLGYFDAVLVRFDAAGNKLWSVQDGTSDFDFGRGVATDAAGNIYLAGDTAGSFGGPTAGMRLMLLKYDAAGNRLWAQARGAGGYTSARGIATDSQGGVFVTGETAGGLDGQPAGGDGDDDPFLVKYDSAGNWIWTQQDATATYQAGNGVAVDGQGHLFTVGMTLGPVDADSHRPDELFVTRTDPVVCGL